MSDFIKDLLLESKVFKTSFEAFQITGEDACSFLQGQTTNDVLELPLNQTSLNALLTKEGRVVSVFNVKKITKNHFDIAVLYGAEDFQKRLESYLVSEEVDIVSQGEKSIYLQYDFANKSEIFLAAGLVWKVAVPDPLAEKIPEKNLCDYFSLSYGKILLNETVMLHHVWNKSKGCFLGQEIVARVESRRGSKNFVHEFPLYGSDEDKADLLYYHAVSLYAEKNDWQSAVNILERVLSSVATHEKSIESLGVILSHHGLVEEAIEWMETLVELTPDEVMPYTNLSIFYLKLGNIEKAEEYKSLASSKTFTKLSKEVDAKQTQKRKEMFLEVLEIDEVDSIALYGLADIEFSLGNHLAAKEHLHKLLSLEPTHLKAKQLLAKLN
jgi:folate-binding Fe-S cluster repair protein YgfZ